MPLRIGIVAGEASGDQLAAGLIAAIKRQRPDAEFEGIAGPHMAAAGCEILYPLEKLSVMGLFEVLGRLRELLQIRKALLRRFVADPPDLFIGVDAPDFNLALEGKLRAAGIPAVHYVSPSVWAWRQSRVRKIARQVDLMLTLFPFEARFYRDHHIPVRFVGHPLADLIPITPDKEAARVALALPLDAKIVALLPGSRHGEIGRLGEPFLGAARICYERDQALRFVVPTVNDSTRQRVEELVAQHGQGLPLTIVQGRSREVMAAADAVLLASGTAALEALLLKRPMVVAYRLSKPTYALVKHLRIVKVPHYSLPNLLARRPLVEELIQDDANPAGLARALLALLEEPERAQALQDEFRRIHESLRCDADNQAANAVLELIASQEKN